MAKVHRRWHGEEISANKWPFFSDNIGPSNATIHRRGPWRGSAATKTKEYAKALGAAFGRNPIHFIAAKKRKSHKMKISRRAPLTYLPNLLVFSALVTFAFFRGQIIWRRKQEIAGYL